MIAKKYYTKIDFEISRKDHGYIVDETISYRTEKDLQISYNFGTLKGVANEMYRMFYEIADNHMNGYPGSVKFDINKKEATEIMLNLKKFIKKHQNVEKEREKMMDKLEFMIIYNKEKEH